MFWMGRSVFNPRCWGTKCSWGLPLFEMQQNKLSYVLSLEATLRLDGRRPYTIHIRDSPTFFTARWRSSTGAVDLNMQSSFLTSLFHRWEYLILETFVLKISSWICVYFARACHLQRSRMPSVDRDARAKVIRSLTKRMSSGAFRWCWTGYERKHAFILLEELLYNDASSIFSFIFLTSLSDQRQNVCPVPRYALSTSISHINVVVASGKSCRMHWLTSWFR